MMLRKLLFGIVAVTIGVISTQAQEKVYPTEVIKGTFIKKTIPLRDFETVVENPNLGVDDLRVVPINGKRNTQTDFSGLPSGFDPVLQREEGGVRVMPIEQNFIGASSSESGATPPDPSGAVGPDHYVHAVNSIVKIFDKQGNLEVGPVSLGNFLNIGTNGGDPIILYDQLADRYFVSQFGSLSNSLAIGVSETNDPTGSYNIYQFQFDAFPDYPHYATWPDAYYLTANKGGSNKVYAIDRQVLLDGGADPQIIGFPLPGNVQNPNTVLSPEPANLLGTNFPANVPGYIVYLQDDGWSGAIDEDHLKIWEIDVDFNDPNSSTISQPLEVPTAPFNSVFAPFGSGDVDQPGTSQKIDMIGGIISFAANYRSFSDHNSWVITFNVDIDGNDTSGVRWVELRNNATDEWSIFQEGTYAPNDGLSRFMGSAAMDAAGNIGLAFNIASGDLPVGIRYTGRFDGDALGEMTVEETTIVDGVGVQTFSNRFGDYSHLTMDPNNFDFWHTAEYFTATNSWASRIASFSFSGGFAADVGVNAITEPNDGLLTAAETVVVSVRNFGTDPQSNFPISLTVDGTEIATETFNGTVNPNETATYTFTETVDLSTVGQTYELVVATELSGDEFDGNNSFSKEVTHLLTNDVGITAITSPDASIDVGIQTVTATVKNFGAAPQSGFEVQYVLDNGAPVVETFSQTIDTDEEVMFTFSQDLDLTDPGMYTLEITTLLTTDEDTSNDSLEKTINAVACTPEGDCEGFGDGVTQIAIADQDIETACSSSGYSDETSTVFNFNVLENNPFIGNLQVGFENSVYAIWIDFDDSGTFEESELISTGQVANPNSNFQFEVNFDTLEGVTDGMHIMRVRGGDVENGTGDVLDPCGDLEFGRTNDFTANIITTLGTEEQAIASSELVVLSKPNNNFDVNLTTDFEGKVYVGVYNMLGQQLKVKAISRGTNGYRLNLDMSAMSSGIYLVRVGSLTSRTYKTAKIIVE